MNRHANNNVYRYRPRTIDFQFLMFDNTTCSGYPDKIPPEKILPEKISPKKSL